MSIIAGCGKSQLGSATVPPGGNRLWGGGGCWATPRRNGLRAGSGWVGTPIPTAIKSACCGSGSRTSQGRWRRRCSNCTGTASAPEAYDGGFLVRGNAVPEADWNEATTRTMSPRGFQPARPAQERHPRSTPGNVGCESRFVLPSFSRQHGGCPGTLPRRVERAWGQRRQRVFEHAPHPAPEQQPLDSHPALHGQHHEGNRQQGGGHREAQRAG